ncbi:MAG: hypothetical protein K6G52_07385, partial [Treponemataceae bacterium]|nr:hypothetical protein [Treponemataceae bacterium]
MKNKRFLFTVCIFAILQTFVFAESSNYIGKGLEGKRFTVSVSVENGSRFSSEIPNTVESMLEQYISDYTGMTC